MATGGGGEFPGGQRPGTVHGLVEPEAVPEVDHQRDHLSLLEDPGGQRVPTHQVDVKVLPLGHVLPPLVRQFA